MPKVECDMQSRISCARKFGLYILVQSSGSKNFEAKFQKETQISEPKIIGKIKVIQ